MDEKLKLENQLCFPLYVCSKEIIKKYAPFLDELDITYTQYLVLMVLWEHGSISIKQMGKLLYLDSGTLTPVVKRLENQGIIERNRDPQDERMVIASLTEKGLALKEKARHIPAQVAQCIDLPTDELKALYKLLYRVLDVI